jgi:ribonuclease D
MNTPPPVRAISKEQIAELPIRRYEGKVRLITTVPDLERARADLRQETVVGLDTETRPAFKKGETYLPCLVQAATARAVYLFQLRRVDVFPVINEMLSDARIVKAGVGLAYDVRQLKQVFPFDVNNVVDLGVIARRRGLGQTGVRNLAGMFLGFRIPKGNRTSNWAAPQLNPGQVAYAATDAWASRELYLKFESMGLLSQSPSPERGASEEAPVTESPEAT